MVTVSKDVSGMITVSFACNPKLVAKVKTIIGRKWQHPFLSLSTTHSASSPESIRDDEAISERRNLCAFSSTSRRPEVGYPK
jgi:hypothetical protein